MQRRHFARAAMLLPLAAGGLLRAQTPWPQRPVKMVLSQPAGSGPDILARYVADQLARAWGQAIVIDNKPGGQNVIGAQAAARSPADGYTLYYATTAAMVTNAYTFKTLPYDAAKDFAPIRLVGRSPFVIACASGFGASDLAAVLAMAKAQPGALTIATEGPKTFSGMLADSVAAMAGVKLTHVPYTKAPDALQDVLGGRVQLVCLPDAALTSYLQGGQLRALAVSTGTRVPTLPGVPSLSETFPGFDYAGWNGIFAPAGTPADIVQRINRDVEAMMQQPEVVQRMQVLGSQVEVHQTVPEFDAFMHAERERWARLVRPLDIRPE